MAFYAEEFPNRLLLTDWSVKKQMKPEDAAKYAYDNNYSCFNYNTNKKKCDFFLHLTL